MNNWAEVNNLISASETITLLCSNQFVKVNFISKILSLKKQNKKIILYLDIDTFFTVFLEDNKKVNYTDRLYVFRVRQDNLQDIILDICSLSKPIVGTIVIDSITSYYHILSDKFEASEVNRELGLNLALLRMTIARSQGQIILTSLKRSSKKKGHKDWQFSYAGGKLIKNQSDLILKLNKNQEKIELDVLKFSNKKKEGKKFSLDLDIENI